ncbi:MULTISPECIES: ATP-binding protein [unclassified Streptomyces]|uniref:ATP-binding protein n=1 Tax=unclassified Streptomyces TaxID=2593676 RepID=UPI002E80B8A6|nr:ATP-binding protein [Streptomyces sp. NBC_00589]WTI37817.1 ATP-binding protein [Streptomyces sp. NBC_00775]WUB28504.1 ATP-binding protein [Streptomyces sp. NBC_00589]
MPETGEPTDNHPWDYTLSIPNDPRAVTICRRTLRLILTLHGLPHLTEVAELVATELVTNAVQHTKGPAAIRLRWTSYTLRIGVWDADPTPPEPTTTATAVDESGRGLALVRDCADGWGWYPLGRSQVPGGTGKFIWCELTAAA